MKCQNFLERSCLKKKCSVNKSFENNPEIFSSIPFGENVKFVTVKQGTSHVSVVNLLEKKKRKPSTKKKIFFLGDEIKIEKKFYNFTFGILSNLISRTKTIISKKTCVDNIKVHLFCFCHIVSWSFFEEGIDFER